MRLVFDKHKTGEASMSEEKFGAFIRREREAREIGLREMAKKIGVSPTYLSKVERDEFPAPAEDKIAAIARILGLDLDETLALAGKVASDVREVIRSRPEMASFLRTRKGAEQVARLAQEALKDKKK
jgi:transcriptional regulator with XRE-family HTH domain